jgi:hypothetical protein
VIEIDLVIRRAFCKKEAGYQVAGKGEEERHAQKPACCPRKPTVKEQHAKNGKTSEPIETTDVGEGGFGGGRLGSRGAGFAKLILSGGHFEILAP